MATKAASKKAKPAGKPAAKPSTPAAGKPAATDTLFDAYWQQPDDAQLRIYADALEQAGDPRGAFIQLSLLEHPTPEQEAARAALQKKHKTALAGPGGAFLREFYFAGGLVGNARAEADKIIAGIDAIGRLNPFLFLTVTSLKTQALAKQFGALDLGRIYFVDFGSITGTHGGSQLPDKILTAIAPAFANVRHLALSCCGRPEQCFSPAGLAAFGASLKQLRYLQLDYYSAGLAPAADYARAIASTPGFATLRAIHCHDFKPGDLGGMKVKLNASEQIPTTRAELEALVSSTAG